MPTPSIVCYCCSDTRSQTNFVTHLMKHDKESLRLVIDPNSSPYSTIRKDERESLFVCFGCKKVWLSALAAKRHFMASESCKKEHSEFLTTIGIERKNESLTPQLKRIKELEHQVQDLQEELSSQRRLGKEQDLVNELRWWSEWSMFLYPILDFVKDRLTSEERKIINTFWSVEHNVQRVSLNGNKTPNEITKLLKDEIKNSSLLQMMLIPNFESYRQSKICGISANLQTLIEGQALHTIHFIPDRHGFRRLNESESESESI